MKKILTYLVLVFALSSLGYYWIINSKALGFNPLLCMFYLMWCPALSGLATYLIYDRNINGVGWGPGKIKWLAIAYLLPLFYAGLAYGFIWLTGLGSINSQYHFSFISLIVFGTLINVAFAAGEEIGWRGFLVPELYQRTRFTATCLITGLIWAVWHFPLILSGLYLAKMPTLLQLLLLVITVTAMTFVISWFRLMSGSVWPAVLLHASHNLYIQRLFDPLTLETSPLSKFMIGESGLVLMAIFIALAVIFWGLRHRLPAPG